MKYYSIGFQAPEPNENESLFSVLMDTEVEVVEVLNQLDVLSRHEHAQAEDGSLYRYGLTELPEEVLWDNLEEALNSRPFGKRITIVEINELDPINDSGFHKGQRVAIEKLFEL